MNKRIISTILPLMFISFTLASCGSGASDSSSEASSTSSSEASNSLGTTTHTVTFDLNYQGSSGSPSAQVIATGGLITKPSDPTRTSYEFTVWARDASGTNTWNFTSDTVTNDMTLYAIWSEIQSGQNRVIYVSLPTWWTVDGGAVSIHMWEGDQSTTWPGFKMNLVSGAIYSYTIPAEYTNFMFARINPATSDPLTNDAYWGAKTVDLSLTAAGSHNLFTIQNTAAWESNGLTADGTWSTYQA